MGASSVELMSARAAGGDGSGELRRVCSCSLRHAAAARRPCGGAPALRLSDVAAQQVAGSDVVLVQAYMMSGRLASERRCRGQATVAMAKLLIARDSGIPPEEQSLVHENEILADDRTLDSCTWEGAEEQGLDGALLLHVVRNGGSSIARGLGALRGLQDGRPGTFSPDDVAGAGLRDVVDSALQAGHAASEQLRPKNELRIAAAINRGKRAELVGWMVQSFALLTLSDSALHSTVLTLDRYYSSRGEPVGDERAQMLLAAVVSLQLKAGEEHGFGAKWKQVVARLAGPVPLDAVFRAETEVLAQLRGEVLVPTPLTFVKELARVAPDDDEARGQPAPELAEEAAALAGFLLDLVAFEPALLYRRAHAVLAAGALSAALRMLEADGRADTAACSSLRSCILQDLLVYDRRQLAEADAEALRCEDELLKLWYHCCSGRRWEAAYRVVQDKHARRGISTLSGRHHEKRVAYRAWQACREARLGGAVSSPGASTSEDEIENTAGDSSAAPVFYV